MKENGLLYGTIFDNEEYDLILDYSKAFFELKKEDLKVSQAFIDEGLVMKRMKFGSRGHVDPIKKRTSHITIVVSDNK